MTSSVVERLCNLPIEFHERGNISSMQLVLDSGVLDDPAEFRHDVIKQHLQRHPELVDEWARWSADKRCSSGWYLCVDERGIIVGYVPGGLRIPFADPISACADFIIKEISEHLTQHFKAAQSTRQRR